MLIIDCTVFGIFAFIAILLAIIIIVKIKRKFGFVATSYRPFVFWLCLFILILGLLAHIFSAAMVVVQYLNGGSIVEKYKQETATTLSYSNKTISDAIQGDFVKNSVKNVEEVVKPEVPVEEMKKEFGSTEVKENLETIQIKLYAIKHWIPEFKTKIDALICPALTEAIKTKLKNIEFVFHRTVGKEIKGMIESLKSVGNNIDAINGAMQAIIADLKDQYFRWIVLKRLADRMEKDLGNLKVNINKLIESEEKPIRMMFIIFLVLFGLYSFSSFITTSIAIVGCIIWLRKHTKPTKLMVYPVYATIFLLFLSSTTFLSIYSGIIEDVNICGVQQNDEISLDYVCPSSNAKFFSILPPNNSFSIKTIGEILKLDKYEKTFASKLKNGIKPIIISEDLKAESDEIGTIVNTMKDLSPSCTGIKTYRTDLENLHSLLKNMFNATEKYKNHTKSFKKNDKIAPFAKFPVGIEKSLVDIYEANFVCNHIYEYSQGICILAGGILDIYTISVYSLLISQFFSILANYLFCMMAECWMKYDEKEKEIARKKKEENDKEEAKKIKQELEDKQQAARIKDKANAAKQDLKFVERNVEVRQNIKNVQKQSEEVNKKAAEMADKRFANYRGI